jgi:PII-like signaling protein
VMDRWLPYLLVGLGSFVGGNVRYVLRIFIGESDRDKVQDRPLYETLVRRSREAHLAGATVLKGPMGFGRHSRMDTAKLLALSTDLPVEAVRIIKYTAPGDVP